ncbi:MAG TPA: phospholipid carrier-dependent glycosyltransferase, partial [Alphaproteobacteria bacterium]|nr:phospholipid carrier-dependent glycosyltransferase [Alphaproteobacteria bacterium]
MTAVLFVFAFTIVVTGIGWTVTGWLDPKGHLSSGERLGVSFLSGCFSVYFGVFFIGAYRLDSVTMWGLAAACIVLSLPGLARMPWRPFQDACRATLTAVSGDKFYGLLWLLTLATALSGLLQGLAPPDDYDSLMYHLALPKYDLEIGRLAIPWDRSLAHVFFPAFGGNISRLALALSNDGAAQMIHGMLAVVAATGTALFVLGMGYGRRIALLAALMFLASRVVIWQMGTVEVDVPLAAFVIFAVIVYRAWRRHQTVGLGILFGLMIGGGILMKLHGLAIALSFAPLMIYDLARKRPSLTSWLAGPVTALGVWLPHIFRIYPITGNPVYPLFNSLFNPGQPNYFAGVKDMYGTGRGIFDVLTGLWNLSVLPMRYFDGMVLGAPYILAFFPLLMLDRERLRRWAPYLAIALLYYLQWFWMMSQQVRFLSAVLPLVMAASAVGAALGWKQVANNRALRAVFATLALTLSLNQAMFVGIYGLLRLPVAFGIISPLTYHNKTPTLTGANYETCRYITKNLKPGETYFSNTDTFMSYYCPQASVVRNYFPDEAKWWLYSKKAPILTFDEFLARVEDAKFRFFMVSIAYESRRNNTAKSIIVKRDPSVYRFGTYLRPVLDQLQPLVKDNFTAVYDGRDV